MELSATKRSKHLNREEKSTMTAAGFLKDAALLPVYRNGGKRVCSRVQLLGTVEQTPKRGGTVVKHGRSSWLLTSYTNKNFELLKVPSDRLQTM